MSAENEKQHRTILKNLRKFNRKERDHLVKFVYFGKAGLPGIDSAQVEPGFR